MTIRRVFADLPHGQVHYRTAGDGSPLLMLHAAPGSARQLAPLMTDLAAGFRVIAPDMPGLGDSDPLGIDAPTISDYAAALVALLDGLGLDRVDVYGSHTGAALGAELAARAPGRVSRLVLDAVGVFSAAERTAFTAHYAQPFVPDLDGTYLLRAWHFLRDQYLFFPWFDRSRAARRDAGLRPAGELNAWLVEVLKAGETYHLAYRAAFAWDAAVTLPRVICPVLAMAAADDPLFEGTQAVVPLLCAGHFVALPPVHDDDFGATRRTTITAFLDQASINSTSAPSGVASTPERRPR